MVLLSRGSGIGQLIVVSIIFLAVLAACYFTTTWIAGYQKKHSCNRNIRIVETMRLAPNKYLQIVEVGETCFVIGIGKDEITFLTELPKEQLKEAPPDVFSGNAGMESFQRILEQWKERIPKGRHKDE